MSKKIKLIYVLDVEKDKLIVVQAATFAMIVIMLFSIAIFKKLSSPYSTNNFVSLHMLVPASSLEMERCILVGNCDEISISQTQASGIAFKTINDKTYILTAEHFCNPYEVNHYTESYLERVYKLHVENYEGYAWDAKVISSNHLTDLCLVEVVDMPPVKTLKFATKMPKMGQDIFTVSEPLGIGPNGTALHFSGKFSGCDVDNMCYYSIPATFGSSGSVILNEDGKIIGMIQRAIMTLNVMSIGVGIDDIRNFLENESIMLNKDLL
jgi:S1-C subfamily serine protease